MAVTRTEKPARPEDPTPESIYRDLVDTQPELLCRFAADGTIRFVNKAYATAFGRTAAQLTGTSLFDLIPAAEQDVVRAAFASLAPDRNEARTEHKATTPEGERWTAWTNRAVAFDAAGRALEIQASGVDITDQKNAEATLHAFYENSSVCMGITELLEGDTEILHIHDNPATCAFFGVEPNSTRGRRALAELKADPRVIGRWIEAYRRAEATKAPVRFQHDYETPQGVRWLAATVSAIGPGPEGRMRFSYVAEDITEQKRGELALRDSDQRLRLALDAGRMGTWEWHIPRGRVTWSEGLERIHGYAPGTFPGTVEAYGAEVHPDDRAHVEAVIANTFAGGEHHNEYRIVRQDGAVRWVEGIGKLFRDAQGQPLRLIGVCTDITERKDAEARLRASEESHRLLAEALQEADRRKDQFLATLAHELRNPLAPLRSGVEVIQRVAGDRPDVARVATMMERQLRHMVRLVDDLLDVSRITRGKVNLQREVIDLGRALQDALETTRAVLELRQHRISVSSSPDTLPVDGDATRLAQVFANLLQNAAKFTPPGGHVEVRMERTDAEAIVAVIDDGIGIDAAMLERVFELFTQVEHPLQKTQAGLGIGLTLARELVELHGGTLEAASDGLGKGSRFTVRLPLATHAATASHTTSPALASTP